MTIWTNESLCFILYRILLYLLFYYIHFLYFIWKYCDLCETTLKKFQFVCFRLSCTFNDHIKCSFFLMLFFLFFVVPTEKSPARPLEGKSAGLSVPLYVCLQKLTFPFWCCCICLCHACCTVCICAVCRQTRLTTTPSNTSLLKSNLENTYKGKCMRSDPELKKTFINFESSRHFCLCIAWILFSWWDVPCCCFCLL